jgi:hypothetical protein
MYMVILACTAKFSVAVALKFYWKIVETRSIIYPRSLRINFSGPVEHTVEQNTECGTYSYCYQTAEPETDLEDLIEWKRIPLGRHNILVKYF